MFILPLQRASRRGPSSAPRRAVRLLGPRGPPRPVPSGRPYPPRFAEPRSARPCPPRAEGLAEPAGIGAACPDGAAAATPGEDETRPGSVTPRPEPGAAEERGGARTGGWRPGETLLQRVTFLHGPRPQEQTRWSLNTRPMVQNAGAGVWGKRHRQPGKGRRGGPGAQPPHPELGSIPPWWHSEGTAAEGERLPRRGRGGGEGLSPTEKSAASGFCHQQCLISAVRVQ